MLRFYYVIFTSVFLIMYFVPLMSYYARHPEKYGELQCYKLCRRVIAHVKRKSRISTRVFGKENLPDTGGYIMYANHQGKYDALGIIDSHEKPCTIVIDSKTAAKFIVTQCIDLIKGTRFVRGDMRQQAKEIIRIIAEVKAGKRYIIFPEAGYTDNKNTLQEFHAGSFKMALKAQSPIVPVVLWDSYKAFSGISLKPVKNQVHFLKPIMFDEYKNMNTRELCALVKDKIQEKLDEIACLEAHTKTEPESVTAVGKPAADAEGLSSSCKVKEDKLVKSRFLGIYDYTVFLTYTSLVFGVFGSFMAIGKNIAVAMACLVIAAFFKKLNERLERVKYNINGYEELRYGKHADSLGNLICFGVLPCTIGFAAGLYSIIHILFYTFYIISVVIRLAYFSAKSESSGDRENGTGAYFTGIPVLTIAILLPALYLFKDELGNVYQLIMTCIYPVAGIFYISSFRIRRPKVFSEEEMESEEVVTASDAASAAVASAANTNAVAIKGAESETTKPRNGEIS